MAAGAAPSRAVPAAVAQAEGPSTALATWCSSVTARLPGVSAQRCETAGLQAGDGRSVRGVPLWQRDIAPAHGTPRLRVLVIGGIHGDEMASVSVVFDWLERARREADPAIHWRMVPLVNPDGLLQQPPRRMNAHGVDLNRNFPTPDWQRDALRYWTRRTHSDPRRYPGPAAMSEPETRWLLKQIAQFRPQLIVSVHAPYGVLDFDGPPPPPRKVGSLALDPVGIYPGSLGNFGGVVQQVPVVTLELRDARRIAPAEVHAMWSDLRGWIDRRQAALAVASRDARQPRAR